MTEQRLQRRLAAILSADVVGYSRLMEIDEAGTLVRLKLLRREIVEAKARALARLGSQLKREIQVKRRRISRTKQSRIGEATR